MTLGLGTLRDGGAQQGDGIGVDLVGRIRLIVESAPTSPRTSRR
jgi:hypothetical protein